MVEREVSRRGVPWNGRSFFGSCRTWWSRDTCSYRGEMLCEYGRNLSWKAIVPQLTAYWPSQLLQAICEGPVLFLLLLLVWHKPKPSGVLAGWFLAGYGVLRILTEVVRQPDEGVNAHDGSSARPNIEHLHDSIGSRDDCSVQQGPTP